MGQIIHSTCLKKEKKKKKRPFVHTLSSIHLVNYRTFFETAGLKNEISQCHAVGQKKREKPMQEQIFPKDVIYFSLKSYNRPCIKYVEMEIKEENFCIKLYFIISYLFLFQLFGLIFSNSDTSERGV